MHKPTSTKYAVQDFYSVPRRYDLATMFVMSLAFAILFGSMRALNWAPVVAVVIGVFVSIVGLAQALLFKGSSPRLASVLVGMAFFPTLFVSIYLWNSLPLIVLYPALLSAIPGAFVGYATGALIGGMFLTADAVRRRWSGASR